MHKEDTNARPVPLTYAWCFCKSENEAYGPVWLVFFWKASEMTCSTSLDTTRLDRITVAQHEKKDTYLDFEAYEIDVASWWLLPSAASRSSSALPKAVPKPRAFEKLSPPLPRNIRYQHQRQFTLVSNVLLPASLDSRVLCSSCDFD